MALMSPPSLLRSRLFLRRFCSPHPKKMSRRGDNPRPTHRWVPVSRGPSPAPHDTPVVPTTASVSSEISKVSSFSIAEETFRGSKRDKTSVAFRRFDSDNPDDYDKMYPPLGTSTGSKRKDYGQRRGAVDIGLGQTMVQDASSSRSRNSQFPDWMDRGGVTPSGMNRGKWGVKSRNRNHIQRKNLPFDICVPGDGGNGDVGKERLRKETEQTIEVSSVPQVLRPGMVLLKHYLSLDEQVDIIKTCHRLGVGPGGFYRPGYGDGAKLRLQMMCLGLNWDPQTKYTAERAGLDCGPPDIPLSFVALVQRAIKDVHALIKENSGAEDAESVIPGMCPDICIVNFYSATGKLGLHQDRDESQESIRKGLPIVSFSVGDSAEFLYGRYRDVERAEKVTLESGDVLIFGGESRLVFHGVKSVIPNSAPKRLLDESKLRSGRLNLTFRQF